MNLLQQYNNSTTQKQQGIDKYHTQRKKNNENNDSKALCNARQDTARKSYIGQIIERISSINVLQIALLNQSWRAGRLRQYL